MTALPSLELVVVGEAFVPRVLLTDLADQLHDFLGTPVTVCFGRGDLEDEQRRSAESRSGDPRRLCSDDLLDSLMERGGPESRAEGYWTLGITANDLYADGRTYVFGEATVGGRWALVSTARFGVAADRSPRLRERLLKESLHELGHLASASHCDDPACLMAISRSVSDIDRKKLEFCEQCRNRILG